MAEKKPSTESGYGSHQTSFTSLLPPPSDVRHGEIRILSDIDSDEEATEIPSKQSCSPSEVIELVRALEERLQTLCIGDESQRSVFTHPQRRVSAQDYYPHTVVAKQRKFSHYESRFQSHHKKLSIKIPQPNISECIICQRKSRQATNEPSHALTNAVIIKTPPSGHGEWKRRLSEIVPNHIYDADLDSLHGPLRRLQISVSRTKHSSKCLSEEKLQSIVRDHVQEFIQHTNWEYLVPQLVSRQLLDDADTEFLLSDKSRQKKGNYFYLQVIKHKGHDAYTRLYVCLVNEKQHLGHLSLVELINNHAE